ncbi:MAG: type II toxin-antitoxin system RelE/ParE family toxin [Nitrospiraceae bacterium]
MVRLAARAGPGPCWPLHASPSLGCATRSIPSELEWNVGQCSPPAGARRARFGGPAETQGPMAVRAARLPRSIGHNSFCCDLVAYKLHFECGDHAERTTRLCHRRGTGAVQRESLKDYRARAKIRVRLDRVSLGNFGDCHGVGEGIQELRVNYGPGYRVYFGQEGSAIVWRR